MSSTKDILAGMHRALEEKLSDRSWEHRSPHGLFAPIHYTLSLGGKRLRPLLCCVAARCFTELWQRALPAAVALEVFHNFTLLHDDLMDRSPLRRGQETVYRRWGDNTAILSGDAMSIEAYTALAEVEDKGLLPALLASFNKMAMEVCIGQQLDMEYELRQEVTVAEYMEMIRLKTSVLLGASLEIGALIGGADSQTAHSLYEAGVELGLAFQIQDDLLDVYGDEATFGKPIGGDIINAKKTLLLLYALEQLRGSELEELRAILELSPEERRGQVAHVRSLYERVGVRAYATQAVEAHTARAYSLLEPLALSEEGRDLLLTLFATLAGRKS
jgi:polyprenyl synthetase